jgi:hypothetical protein
MKSNADNKRLFAEANKLREKFRLELHNKAYNNERNKSNKKNHNEKELAFN